jgi:hypothetical protein
MMASPLQTPLMVSNTNDAVFDVSAVTTFDLSALQTPTMASALAQVGTSKHKVMLYDVLAGPRPQQQMDFGEVRPHIVCVKPHIVCVKPHIVCVKPHIVCVKPHIVYVKPEEDFGEVRLLK